MFQLLRTPEKNERNTAWMHQVIGNKYDDEGGNSVVSMLYNLMRHNHSPSKVYPTGTSGVSVAENAAAWTLGNAAEIIPANTVTRKFDIHYIIIEGASDNDTYELVLYGNGSEIGRVRFRVVDIANARILPMFPIQTAQMDANTMVTAKVMGAAGGENVTISVFYHEY